MKFPIQSIILSNGRVAFILFALLLSVHISSDGQTISSGTYPFTSSTGVALEDMSTGTATLLGPGWDDGISAVTNIGFDFYFVGKYYNQFSINSNGLMKLNNVANTAAVTGESANAMASTANLPKIAPYWDNLSTGTNGKLHCKTIGTAPNRKLIVEWLNLNIPRVIGVAGAAVCQVWLYENTGIIEFVYGGGFIANSAQYSIGIGNSATVFASVTSSTPSCAFGTANNANTVAIASGTKYTFTPIQATVAAPLSFTTVTSPSASTINLQWTDNSTNETGFNVFRSTDGIDYTYINTVTSTSVATTGNTYSLNNTGLSPTTTYYFKVIACNEGVPSTSLDGSFATTAITTYTWVGPSSCAGGDWTVPANWSPSRVTPDASDKLIFNCGGNVTVTGVPTQTIGRLTIQSNTTVNLQCPATATLTLASDNNSGTNELSIENGSSLYMNSTVALTLAFSGTGSTGSIAGRLEIINTSFANIFNVTGAVVTVASNGVLAGGTVLGTSPWTGSSATTLIINGTYEHKYTSAFGFLPTAKWETNSNCNIIGYTSAAAPFADATFAQTFYNFTYNCPLQDNVTSNINFVGFVPTITGTFYMISTGSNSSAIRLAGSTTSYTKTWNNYEQTGGIFDFGNTSTGVAILNINGTFNQTGGIFRSTNSSLTGTPVTLNFSGTSGIQNVNFFDAAPSGPITYRISNPDGINLTGSGLLTTNFNVNKLGGIRISTPASTPISTALNFVYNGKWTTLTYDAVGSYSMTAREFPSSVGPSTITVAVGANNILTMPFTRLISPADTNGVLTMTSGILDISSNNLTLGTSAAFPGTLVYTAPARIRCTTGTFTRWYPASGLPIVAGGTSIGWYPLSNGINSRDVSIYFSSATALSAGGTISVSHFSTNLFTTGLNILDGAYTINQRTNASWTFTTGNGINASGTIGVRITSGNIFNTATPANLRMMQSASVVGTFVAGGGSLPNYTVQRAGLTIANLSSQSYYVGASSADISLIYTAVSNGNWSTGSTWDQGVAPGAGDVAIIQSGVTVTTDGNAPNVCKVLTINSGATLTANTATLVVDSNLVNNGSINIGGGAVTINGGLATVATNGLTSNSGSTFSISSGSITIGPANGGNKVFTSAGTSTVTGGTVTINGSINITGAFSQSSGTIIIDGNTGVSGTSTASVLFNVSAATATLSFTGGSITIVDPPFGTGNSISINQSASVSNATAFGGTHSWLIGDGVSTTSGGINGFVIDLLLGTGRVPLNNVTINGSTGTNRFARNTTLLAGGTIFKGIFTVNSGSEFRWFADAAGDDGYMGNVINNGLIVSQVTTAFGIPADMVASGFFTLSGTQTLTGSGIWQNAVSSPTAEISGVYMNNPNGLNISGLSGTFRQSGILTFVSGTIVTGNVIYAQISGATVVGAAPTTGWVYGNLQKPVTVGTSVLRTFETGDINYAPATITFASVTADGNLIVKTTNSDHPSISTSGLLASKSVNRYWSFNNLGVGFTNASVGFSWQSTDNDLTITPGNLRIGKFTSPSTWDMIPVSGIPGATSIASTSSVISFGDFVIAEVCEAPALSVNAVNISCNGMTDGTIDLTTTGGSSPFTYSWSGPGGFIATTEDLSALASGTYTVFVTTPGGCSSTTNAIISEPALLTSIEAHTNVSCYNGNDGSVTFTASGGTLPYTYSVNNGGAFQSSNAFNSLVAGNYDLIVKDARNCQFSLGVISIGQPASLPSFSFTQTDASCFGGNNGSVTFTASGGTPPYTYSVDNGNSFQSGNVVNGLTAGMHDLVVRDLNNCLSIVQQATILQPSAITFNASPSNVTCINGNDGSISISSPAGGNGAPFEYSKNNGLNYQVGSTFTSLTAGSYPIRLKDVSGCESAASNIVVGTSPVQYVVSASAFTGGTISPSGNINADCGSDVSFVITPDFCFKVDSIVVDGLNVSSSTSYTLSNIISTHIVNVYFSQRIQTITATAGSNGSINPAGGVSVNCNSNKTFTITPDAGSVIGDVLVDGVSIGAVSSYTFMNVTANHTIHATFTTCNNPATANAGNDTTICSNVNYILHGSIGGSATSAVWSTNGTGTFNPDISFQNATSYQPSMADISAGSVYLVLTTNDPDNAGPCVQVVDSLLLTIKAIPSVNITGNLSYCAGQTNTLTANATAGSGTVSSYQWVLNGSTSLGNVSTQVTTGSGNYSVTVSYTNSCSSSASVSVTENQLPSSPVVTPSGPLSICNGDSVQLNSSYASGNVWTPGGQTTSGIYAKTNGNYSVTYSDLNGCTSTSNLVSVIVLQSSASISVSNSLCTGSGDSALLIATSNPIAVSYLWSTTETNDSIYAHAGGSNSVQTTDGNGCTATATTIVISNAVPVVTISGNNTLCTGVSNTLTANATAGSGSISSVQWFLNGTTPIGSGNSITVSTAGSYKVIVTNSNGCSSTSTPFILSSSTPLSGTYTIGNGAASCTNYISFASAISDLNTRGVGGNVIFNVASGYTETAPSGGLVINYCALNDALKPSASKTVTFAGGAVNALVTAPVGTAAATDGIFFIVGGDYLTIDKIDLQESAGNTTNIARMEWGYALLKCDGTDGANNNTISNCSITLNKANVITTPVSAASIGIYMGNHTATNTTALTYSGVNTSADSAKFRSSNNQFFGNSVQNVYRGISINGSTVPEFYDQNNIIGSSTGSGNIVTNWGGGASTVAPIGILATMQQNSSVLRNTVNGGTGTSAAQVTGISYTAGFGGTVSGNTVTITSSNTAAANVAIISTAGGTNHTVSLTDNIVENCTWTTVTTGTFIGVRHQGAFPAHLIITGNQVRNSSFIPTANFAAIFVGVAVLNTGGSLVNTVMNRNTVSGINFSATGLFTGIENGGTTPLLSMDSNVVTNCTKARIGTMNCISYGTPGTATVNANIVTNNTITGGAGASTMSCVIGGTSEYEFRNNTIINNSITGMTTTNVALLHGLNNTNLATRETVTGNVIRKLFITGTSTAAHAIRGLYQNGAATCIRTISGNTIDSLYSSLSAAITAITSANGAVININNNKIFDLLPGQSTGVSYAKAIVTSNGALTNVYNNIINLNIGTSTLNTNNSVNGIEVGNIAGSKANVYFNSIRLAGSGTGTAFGSSGISLTGALTNADLRNNIVVNLLNAGSGGAASAVALRRVAISLTGYDASSNNNIWYAGTASTSHLLYYDGTNSDQTLSAFQGHVSSRESNSRVENVDFQSTTGSSPDLLKVNTSTPTYVEGGALVIQTPVNITSDYFGTVRNTTSPDIGAHEDQFVNIAPVNKIVTIAPATSQCNPQSRLVTVEVDPAGASVDSVYITLSFNAVSQPYIKLSNGGSGNIYSGTIPVAIPLNAIVSWSVISVEGVYSSTYMGASYQDAYLTTLNFHSSATPTFMCAGLSSTIRVDSLAGFTFQWSDGNNIVSNYSTFSASPNSTTTYTVTLTDANGCTKTESVLLTVFELPATPVATNSTQCGVGVPVASVKTGGGDVRWYLDPVGGSPLSGQNDTVLTNYPITVTDTFYVSEFSGSCEGSRAMVIANVTQPDPVQANATPGSICLNSSLNLSAIQTGSGNVYNFTWTSSDPGSGIVSSLTGQSINITPTISGTYSYTVTAFDNNNSCIVISAVNATVNPLPVITSTSISTPEICAGSNDTLKAFGCSTCTEFAEHFETLPFNSFTMSGTNVTANQSTTYYSDGSGSLRLTYINSAVLSGLYGMSSSIDLTTKTNPKLKFDHICALEAGSDFGRIQYSVDDGATWIMIPATAYQGTGVLKLGVIGFDKSSYSDWNSQFTAITSTPGTGPATSLWKTETIDLSAFTSATQFRIRFVLTSSASNVYYGWLIDNTRIESQNGPGGYSWIWNPGSLNGNIVVVNPTTTTNYIVTATNLSGCTSSSTMSVTVNPTPAAPAVVDSVQCGYGVPNVSVNGGGGLYRWYLTSSLGNPIPNEQGSKLTNYNISNTTTFYVAEYNGLCEGTRSAVIADVTQPDLVTADATNDSICLGQTLNLTAIHSGIGNNYSYTWKSLNGPNSGIADSLAGQSINIVPTVSGNFSYLVIARDIVLHCTYIDTIDIKVHSLPVIITSSASANTICAGTPVTLSAYTGSTGPMSGQVGTSTTTFSFNQPNPYSTANWANKNQYLILASEMTAAGFTSGSITSLGFRLGSSSTTLTLNNFVLKMGQTSLTALPPVFQTGLTTVCVDAAYPVQSHNNSVTNHAFNVTPFVWNGTSNIIIETCFTNTAFNGSQTIFYTSTPFVSAISHSNNVASVCASPGTPATSTNRPNIYMNGISLIEQAGNYTWIWNPGSISSNVTTLTPGSSTIFTVTATDNSTGCSNSDTAGVTVITGPINPNISSSLDTSCSSAPVTLTWLNPVVTAMIQWQNSTDGINWTNISSANGSVYLSPPLSTSLYFRAVTTCSQSDTSNVKFVFASNPVISGVTPATRCGEGVVSLSVTGIGTLEWFANSSGGTALNSGSTYSPSVTSTTTYWVQARIGSCFYPGGRQSVTATVNAAPPVTINVNPKDSVCYGTTVTLSAISSNDPGYTYEWSLDQVNTFFTGTHYSFTADSSRRYYLHSIDNSGGSNNGCVYQTSVRITVNSLPVVPVVAQSSSLICFNGQNDTLTVTNLQSSPALQYNWSPSTYLSSDTGSMTISTPAATTTYTVTATVISTGCTSNVTVTVNYGAVTQPTINSSGGTTICEGTNTTLDAGGGYSSYSWSDGNSIIGTSQSLSVTPSSTTQYTVTVSNGSSCTTTASVQIMVQANTQVSITAGGSTSFCSGDSVMLSVPSGYASYEWSDGNTITNGVHSIVVKSPGNYTVTVSVAAGCTSSDSQVVIVNPLPPHPTVSPLGPIDLCDDGSNSPVILTADTTGTGAGAAVQWNNVDNTPDASVSIYFDALDFVIYGNTVNFNLTVTNAFGCRAVSSDVTVNLITCTLPPLTLHAKLFIEGYYTGGGMMDNYGTGGCLSYSFVPGAQANQSDTITLSLMATAAPHGEIAKAKAIMLVDGTVTVSYPGTVPFGNYYIKITHRNALETWSANPVAIGAVTSYDFTTAANKAYGNNMVEMEPGKWAIYSGDISDANITGLGVGYQDLVIEAQDYLDMENAVSQIKFGYDTEDITGDGIVEAADYLLMENAVAAIRFSYYP